MHVHALGNVNDKLHICVIVVISAPRDFHILISHADVICVGLQVLWGGHDSELNRSLIAERLICPFPYRADLLDSSNSIVRNEYLRQALARTDSSFSRNTTCRSDHSVPVVGPDEVFDLAFRRHGQVIATDKVRGKLESRRIRAPRRVPRVRVGIGPGNQPILCGGAIRGRHADETALRWARDSRESQCRWEGRCSQEAIDRTGKVEERKGSEMRERSQRRLRRSIPEASQRPEAGAQLIVRRRW